MQQYFTKFLAVTLRPDGVITVRSRLLFKVKPFLTIENDKIFFSPEASKNWFLRTFVLDAKSLPQRADFRIYLYFQFASINFDIRIPSIFYRKYRNKNIGERNSKFTIIKNGLYYDISTLEEVKFEANADLSINKKFLRINLTILDKIFNSKATVFGLRAKSREKGRVLEIPLDNCMSNTYQFVCNKFSETLYPESRWDVFLLYRTHSGKELSSSLSISNAINHDKDRYLAHCLEDKGDLISMYVTEGTRTLALWVTDPLRFNDVYRVAKGKSIYKEGLLESVDENLWLFESFLGKAFSGNPKYLYLYLYENYGEKYKYVCVHNEGIKLPGNPIVVQRGSEEYFHYLSRAKYWINNIVFPVHQKRSDTIYIQTWHGTPLKKLGFDITISGPETAARESFYSESRNWDYLISANRFSSTVFKTAFRYKNKILEYGYPQNDSFYKKNDIGEGSLQEKLGIRRNQKVVLYAPTWRDSKGISAWCFEQCLMLDLSKLQREFGDEVIVLLRLHHLSVLSEDEALSESIIDVSKYEDVQDLCNISDVLITDYSSILFDFFVSKKPVILFPYDLEEYDSNMRGFYFNYYENLPFPIVTNTDELIEQLKFTLKEFVIEDRLQQFWNDYCSLSTGDSAAKVIKHVLRDKE